MNLKDQLYTPSQQDIIRRVQVNIPFIMLAEASWQELVFALDLNPEIGLDATALDQFTASDFSEVAEKLHNHGLTVTIHGPFLDLSPGSPDTVIREATGRRFQQMIEAVDIFKSESVVCHAAYDTYRYDFCREQWYANSIETWQWVANAIKERGSRLMLENVYEQAPEDLLALLNPFDPELIGCCLDVGHQYVFSQKPLSEWLEKLGPRIGHLHLHDNNADFDAHLPMGSGSIDFKPVADFLSGPRAVPIITLEPHRREDFRTSVRYLDSHEMLSI